MKTVLGSVSLAMLLLFAFSGIGVAQWNGEIVAWGSNNHGQCDVPDGPPNRNYSMVAGGFHFSLGPREDGSIVVWGWNSHGQCSVPSPNSGFTEVAGGWRHSLAVKEDGSIVAWGYNYYGQCDVPGFNEGFTAIAGGGSHSLGLRENGSIEAWGHNGYGQCDVPQPNSGFVAVAGGGSHSLGLREISTGIEDEELTGDFIQIRSVAPNPFPATTTIIIAVPAPGPVRLDVFDLAGRCIGTLLNQTLSAGNHTAVFDGTGLTPGVYLVRLISGSECATAKVVLVR